MCTSCCIHLLVDKQCRPKSQADSLSHILWDSRPLQSIFIYLSISIYINFMYTWHDMPPRKLKCSRRLLLAYMFVYLYVKYNPMLNQFWLVVSTPLKNISELGWLFPIHGKIKNIPSHQPNHARCVWTSNSPVPATSLLPRIYFAPPQP